MDHLLISRWTSDSKLISSSAPDLRISKKRRTLKRALFGSRLSPPNPSSNRVSNRAKSNSELVNVLDAQLMQIREKLAAFREQDTEFRERMDSLNGSVSELASRSSLSSFTPSECSDLDEAMREEVEEFEQQTAGQREQPEQLLSIPTVMITGCRNHFNQPLVTCFHMRRVTSDPNCTMMQDHVDLPEEEAEAMETRRHSSYSADRLFPHYNNPEKISTLF